MSQEQELAQALESCALAVTRHTAQRMLREGDRAGARRELARCALLLHQARPRTGRPAWPGEYAAMRPLRYVWR